MTADWLATLERVAEQLQDAITATSNGPTRWTPSATYAPHIGLKRVDRWREALKLLRGLLAEPQPREDVCEVCEEPVRDLGFIVHPEEGTSICHRCAYELVAAEAKLLREICRTNGWPDLAEPQADDEDQRREDFEQLVTDILVSLDPFLTLLDGPDVDHARESVMRELLAESARLAEPQVNPSEAKDPLREALEHISGYVQIIDTIKGQTAIAGIVSDALAGPLAEGEESRKSDRKVTTPFDDPIVQACIDHGGHFWPPDASEGEPATCTRCWYNPGWKAGKSRSEAELRPVIDNPQA